MRSLPFHRTWRLARDVVHHAVDPRDLGHDAAADPPEHVVGQLGPVRRHRVGALHGAQDDRARVGTLVAHHAHAADVGQHREVLPHGPLDHRPTSAPALDLAVWLAALLETKGGFGYSDFSGIRPLPSENYRANSSDSSAGGSGRLSIANSERAVLSVIRLYSSGESPKPK